VDVVSAARAAQEDVTANRCEPSPATSFVAYAAQSQPVGENVRAKKVFVWVGASLITIAVLTFVPGAIPAAIGTGLYRLIRRKPVPRPVVSLGAEEPDPHLFI